MSDETGNGDFVLCCVSGCYAEVHISCGSTSVLYGYLARAAMYITALPNLTLLDSENVHILSRT